MQVPGTPLHVTSAYASGVAATSAPEYADQFIQDVVLVRLATPEGANGFRLGASVPDSLSLGDLAAALSQTVQTKDGRGAFVVSAKPYPKKPWALLVQVKRAGGSGDPESEADALLAAAQTPAPKASTDWRTAAKSRPAPIMDGRLWTNPDWGQKPTVKTVAARIIEQLVQPSLVHTPELKRAQVVLPKGKGIDAAALNEPLDDQTRSTDYVVSAMPHSQQHDRTIISFSIRERPADVDEFIKHQVS